MDSAYEPIVEVRQIIADAENFAAIADTMRSLAATVSGQDPAVAAETLKDIESQLARMADTSAIRSALTSARRNLTARTPRPERALPDIEKAVTAYNEELGWRTRAASELSGGLARYDAAIAQTIGLRLQERLPASVAGEMAACLSIHRDISLHF